MVNISAVQNMRGYPVGYGFIHSAEKFICHGFVLFSQPHSTCIPDFLGSRCVVFVVGHV
ncbi:hypothetical protein DSUL_80065 [Desulfovibrionales bacterium]